MANGIVVLREMNADGTVFDKYHPEGVFVIAAESHWTPAEAWAEMLEVGMRHEVLAYYPGMTFGTFSRQGFDENHPKWKHPDHA